ncbi:MAG TPA: hypothetical protein V6D17_16555 [Candidatus Obscuribacterales bacterium]
MPSRCVFTSLRAPVSTAYSKLQTDANSLLQLIEVLAAMAGKSVWETQRTVAMNNALVLVATYRRITKWCESFESEQQDNSHIHQAAQQAILSVITGEEPAPELLTLSV